MHSTRPLQKSAEELIKKFNLDPHPYGCGYFKETDRDSHKAQIEKNNGEMVERNLSTCIIAIFKGDQINPLHRTNSTQIIHCYPGGNSNLLVHIINKNGKLKTYNMPEDTIQLKIPSLTWFALEVESKDEAAFVVTGHTVSPGFDINDFELGNRKGLIFQYPSLSDFISKFTLDDSSLSCTIKDNAVETQEKLNDEPVRSKLNL